MRTAMAVAGPTQARRNAAALWSAIVVLVALLALSPSARGANIAVEESESGAEPRPVEQDAPAQRVIVGPEPRGPNGDMRYWRVTRTPPRISMWIDRGEWSTYRPGERLSVYFRVDRPCYVTIVDYSPDGSVDILFPNRWSSMNFVRPGRAYRIPESTRYSLRIAGRSGIETLVACAHEVAWPVGPYGRWLPTYGADPYYPPGAREGGVVVGSEGPRWPDGRDERLVRHDGDRYDRDERVVVGGPGHWPVPPEWHDRPERWSCASVSFYVEEDRHWRGRHRDSRFRDEFVMKRCGQSYYRDIYYGNEAAVLSIECVESYDGRPTAIVGRLTRDNDWESEVVFRIDVDGRHGKKPKRGRSFKWRDGPLRVDIKILDYGLRQGPKRHGKSIDWIRFDVNVRGR